MDLQDDNYFIEEDAPDLFVDDSFGNKLDQIKRYSS
jgi:hypothetical protein